MNLYKVLWSRIGGRKWTFIWRDVYHLAPYVIQVLWVSIGCFIGVNFGWKGLLIFWLIYSFGFLEGHFHWGTKYIKGQK